MDFEYCTKAIARNICAIYSAPPSFLCHPIDVRLSGAKSTDGILVMSQIFVPEIKGYESQSQFAAYCTTPYCTCS